MGRFLHLGAWILSLAIAAPACTGLKRKKSTARSSPEAAAPFDLTAPEISNQPTDLTIDAGLALEFTVAAIALTEPSYQWYLNDVAIDGATASTYSKAIPSFDDEGIYKVVVSNSAGSVTSSAVRFQINRGYMATRFDGSRASGTNNLLKKDSKNNLYVAFTFSSASLSLHAGTETLTRVGSTDGVLVKYDAGGNFKWLRHFAASSSIVLSDLAIDSSNNVVVSGITGSSATTLYDQDGVTVQTIANLAAPQSFIAKFSSAGSFAFCKTLKADTFQTVQEIEIEPQRRHAVDLRAARLQE